VSGSRLKDRADLIRSCALSAPARLVRIIDDYCLSVEKKPLRDCQTVRKRSGRV